MLTTAFTHMPQVLLESRPALTSAGLGGLLACAPELSDLSLRHAVIAADGLQASSSRTVPWARGQPAHTRQCAILAAAHPGRGIM